MLYSSAFFLKILNRISIVVFLLQNVRIRLDLVCDIKKRKAVFLAW